MGLGVTGGIAWSVAKDDQQIVDGVLNGVVAGFAVWTAPLWVPPLAIGTAIGKAARIAFPPPPSRCRRRILSENKI